MANTIQVKRGANASIPTLNSGEFGFSTDTKQIYIGDGAENYELASVTEVNTISGSLQTNIDSHASNHTDGTDDIQNATNSQKGLATASQITDIEANTAHKTSTGADHSYIDQTVVSGTDPTFVGTNITEIPSANVHFNVIGTPTYKTAQDWFDVIQSSGILDGFVLSNSRIATELDVAVGKGIIKETDSELGATVSFETGAVENITLTSDNINYIYVDYNAGTPQIVATTDRSSIELNRMFIIGRVYKDGTTLHILSAGVHISNLARTEHERLVERDGFTYTLGSVTSETGTLNLDVTAGVWYLGHNRIVTDALNSNTGGDTWTYTHYGAASWITDNSTASAVDCTHYNAGTDAIGTLGTNNYGTQWIYITADNHWYIIYGTQNGQLTVAEDASPPASIPTYIETMGELIAKMIVKQDGTIVDIQIVHDITFTTAGVANHNETGGIQGGTANEYYHLTSVQHTDLTDGGDSTSHKHDDRYYTELEIDTISGSLNTKIDGKSDTGHLHDDRYYTESEVDTISGTLSSEIDSDIATHTSNADAHHSESHTVVSHSDTTATGANLNELVGAGDTSLHKHDDRYYTESEVDTISGSLNTKIDGKAATSHTHDDRYYTETELNNGQLDNRYYTESEVDTISGSLNTNINSHASNHTDGTDDIQDATDSQKGLATSTQITKLDGIATGADVTADNPPQAHDLDSHSSCTLAELSADITDATLIDTTDARLSDARPPTAHKNTHDPIDGYDALDTADGASIAGVQAVGKGNSNSFSRADHVHGITHSISDNALVTVDDADVVSTDYAKFTADGLEGREASEVRADINVADGADVTGDNPPQAHNHDSIYYTETEINTWRNSTTQTEMGYVNGVTSDIQTQLGTKLANVSEDTTPELGGQLVVGEHDIKLDSILSADGKYSGKTCDGVLGATIAYGDLVYLDPTNQKWKLTDADAEATSGNVDLAIVLAAGNDGDTRLLLIEGYVREDDWNFTSTWKALYVSTTAGGIAQDISGYTTGDIVRVVGYTSISADQMHFKPSNTWLELA